MSERTEPAQVVLARQALAAERVFYDLPLDDRRNDHFCTAYVRLQRFATEALLAVLRGSAQPEALERTRRAVRDYDEALPF